jgi:hypothetical protein
MFWAWCASRRADEALMRDAVNALEFHSPTLRTETTIARLRARLEGTTS